MLGRVLAGAHPGRRGRDELTVYAPVGLPWQDLAAAWTGYRAAVAQGRGMGLDLPARRAASPLQTQRSQAVRCGAVL